MPSGIFKVQIAPFIAPKDLATFQINEFDTNELDDMKRHKWQWRAGPPAMH